MQDIFAQKSDNKYKIERKKRKNNNKTPATVSNSSLWAGDPVTVLGDVLEEPNLDKKVENFHNIKTAITDKHFPEKHITISNLDKKWMTPQIKQILRIVQSEYYRKGKSPK